MNCESCEPPKNSLIAATMGRLLIKVAGVAASGPMILIRSLIVLSSRSNPIRN